MRCVKYLLKEIVLSLNLLARQKSVVLYNINYRDYQPIGTWARHAQNYQLCHLVLCACHVYGDMESQNVEMKASPGEVWGVRCNL